MVSDLKNMMVIKNILSSVLWAKPLYYIITIIYVIQRYNVIQFPVHFSTLVNPRNYQINHIQESSQKNNLNTYFSNFSENIFVKNILRL